jgi:hypothetical protein
MDGQFTLTAADGSTVSDQSYLGKWRVQGTPGVSLIFLSSGFSGARAIRQQDRRVCDAWSRVKGCFDDA